jgi:hypothetical protein
MYYLRFFIYDVGACKHKPINTKEAVRNDMYKKTEVVSAEWSLFFCETGEKVWYFNGISYRKDDLLHHTCHLFLNPVNPLTEQESIATVNKCVGRSESLGTQDDRNLCGY